MGSVATRREPLGNDEVMAMVEKPTDRGPLVTAHEGSHPEDQLDRQPGSNRGRKGQMRASRRVARSQEDGLDPAAAQDDMERGYRSNG